MPRTGGSYGRVPGRRYPGSDAVHVATPVAEAADPRAMCRGSFFVARRQYTRVAPALSSYARAMTCPV
eukprot:2664730-Rhodomonas_salina.5